MAWSTPWPLTPSATATPKEHFAPIRPAEILDKIASLPISEWNYKTAIGPTCRVPVSVL